MIKKFTVNRQILATLIVNILTFNDGVFKGIMAPNIVVYQTEDSPITQVTTSEASIIISICSMGGFLGVLIFGPVADLIGRKWTIIIMAIPMIFASFALIFGLTPIYVIISRFLVGLSAGGVLTIIPMFVTEISDPTIRGTLGAAFPIFWGVGMLVGYIIPNYLDYVNQPILCAVLAIVFICTFVCLPESPEYLSKRGYLEEAHKSYGFYGNRSAETAENISTKQFWHEMKEPQVLRGFGIGIVLLLFCVGSGFLSITCYITDLLSRANMQMNIFRVTILMGVFQITGSFISSLCMDRFGRRFLFLVSAGISGVALFVLGLYFYLLKRGSLSGVKDVQWVALVFFGVFILGSCLAVGTAPYTISPELLPTSVRAKAMTILLLVEFAGAICAYQFFYPIMEWIGVEGIMWSCTLGCLVEMLFVYFVLPETKNLTTMEIQAKLKERSI